MVRCCGIVINTAFFISSFKGGQPPAGAKSTCWTDVLCALSIRRGRAAGHSAPRKKREGTLEMSSLFKLGGLFESIFLYFDVGRCRPQGCRAAERFRDAGRGGEKRNGRRLPSAGIKSVVAKPDFATTWKGRLKSIFLNGEKCRPQGGSPTASPAQRVAVGKEEQGSGRMTSFLPLA